MGACMITKIETKKNNLYSLSSFKFIEVIGKGTFGQVWKVKDKKTGELYALKVMEKSRILSKKSVEAILNQKKVLELLALERSDLIANIKASFHDRQKVYILMDYVNGQNLREFLDQGKKIPQEDIKFIVVTLLKIMRYVHSKQIIHGDIKPENIVINNEGLPYLTDFGCASFYTPNNSHQNGGTLPYMAPEVIKAQNHGYSVDFYAIGLIAYQLFFNKRPHKEQTFDQLREQILSKDINSQSCPELNNISPQAADFLIKVIQRRPSKRLGKNSIQQVLNHPWIKSERNDSLVVRSESKLFQKMKIKTERTSSKNQSSQSEDEEYNSELVESLLNKEYVQKMFEPFSQSLTSISNTQLPSAKIEQRQYTLKTQDIPNMLRKSISV